MKKDNHITINIDDATAQKISKLARLTGQTKTAIIYNLVIFNIDNVLLKAQSVQNIYKNTTLKEEA